MGCIRIWAVLFALGCRHAPPSQPEAPPVAYPTARRDPVVDDYFGTKVPDPYRWLEATDSPDTRAWIEAQNALTRAWIDAVPARPAIRERLQTLWNYERYSAPIEEGGRYFYRRNTGLQDQDVLYVADALDAPGRVLIDPNGFSADGKASLAATSIREDAAYIAYGISDGGSDWTTWRIRDVETGQDLPDELKWIKFGRPVWSGDGAGLYYSRFPEPKNLLTEVNEHNKVYYHRLGTSQADDVLVYERPDHPRWDLSPWVSEDGRWLVIYIHEGTEPKNRLHLKDLSRPGAPVVPVLDAFDAWYGVISTEGSRFVVLTNHDAPRQRVIEIDVTQPEKEHWKEIVPQGEHPMEDAGRVGDRLFVEYLRDARSEVRTFGLDGRPLGEVSLPGLGSVWGFDGEPDDAEAFYAFSSFTQPTVLYRYDLATGVSTVWKQPQVAFDPSLYETRQVFYASKDGTKIPMFLVSRKGVVLDGSNPTLLYGYGGFNVSLKPYYSGLLTAWLERGGVYAVPNLRGGGEYGEDWHQAGILDRKQNVFDDFIAAAEWLVADGWTSTPKLAIHGSSNGGLLVGAVLTQRPELFGAAIPDVGVLDMLRYHRFTIGWAWASDYGTSEDPALFPVLYRYSPYHNVRPGVRYPPTLVTTADHDDRVVPGHSFKFAAALQHAQAGPAPILIRIETRIGHGGGAPLTARIDKSADQLAFLVRALGMES